MDPVTGREILERLIELKRKMKITLIMASHGTGIHSEADHVLFMKTGKIIPKKEAGY